MLKFIILCGCFAVVFSENENTEKCIEPEVKTKTYYTDDATLLKQIAYIAEFRVTCSSGTFAGNLYSMLNGHLSPVAYIGQEKYQVSWSEDVKTAKTGEISFKIYDEFGHSSMRKALRNNESIENVKEFAIIRMYHDGIYNGPWISCEFLAAVISIGVAYYAIHCKNKM